MEVVREGIELLVATEGGYAKRTSSRSTRSKVVAGRAC